MGVNQVKTEKNPTKFEKCILTKNSNTKNTILNFTSTAYLRKYDFKNALIWLNKSASADENSLSIYTNYFNKETVDRWSF